MNFMKWDTSLSIHVREIDAQHRKLVGIVNRAHETAMVKEREKGDEVLNELIEFVRVHFSTEEKYFEEFAYGGTAEHIAEHLKLTERVIRFKQAYDKGKCNWGAFLNFLKEWLEAHLKVMDQKYFKCFKEHGLK